MKVAILDDQVEDAKQLAQFMEKYMEESKLVLEIELFHDPIQFLETVATQREPFDMIVLDIDIPEVNGIHVAKKIRQQDQDVVLMFFTNMPQYALDAYSVDAIDYIIKPVTYPDFLVKMKKAIRYVRRNRSIKITLRSLEGYDCISISDIYYIESQLHYLIYHTVDGTYRVRGILNAEEDRLRDFQFVRCSNSFLVNLKHVQAITGDDITINRTKIRVTRTRKNEFFSTLTKYYGGLR